MKEKKIFISRSIVLLVCILIVGGFASQARKRPIKANEMSYAEVIEYEEGETDNSEEASAVVAPNVQEEENLPENDEKCCQKLSICVFGNSKKSLSPNMAEISACIEMLDSDMVKAKENVFDCFENVLAGLKEKGIEREDIVLERFNSYPNYDYEYGRKVIGYYSNICFTVNVSSLDKIKDCVDEMTEKGVTEIRDVVYKVSDMDEQYNNALSEAIENAKAKAIKILGREDLQIVSVKEEHVYSCNSLYRSFTENLSSSDLIGKVDIEARVLVEFN